jgi:hypothetical protein
MIIYNNAPVQTILDLIYIAWASCAASELGLRRASGRQGTSTGQEGGSADA